MVAPGAEVTDNALAPRAAAGDEHAFEALVHRYEGRVYRLACRLTSETDEGHATAEQRAAIERHVHACPRCLAFIASYQETPRILRTATERELPSDLSAALQSVLRRQRRGTG